MGLSKLQLKRTFHLVWQSAPRWTIASIILVIIQGVLPLITLYLMKLVIDAIASGITNPDKLEAFKDVAILVAITGVVGLLISISNSLAGFVREQQTELVTEYMNNLIHAKSIAVDLEYYENPRYYDTLHRAQHEGPYRPTQIINGLVQTAQNGISLIAMAGLLFTFHWVVPFFLILTALPGISVRLRYSRRMYEYHRKQTPSERVALYLQYLLTGQTHAKEVRTFGLGGFIINRFNDIRRLMRRERMDIVLRRSIYEMLAHTISTITVLGFYLFIAYRAVHGIITVGSLVMYYQAFQRGQGAFTGLLNNLSSLYENSLFLNNLYEFLDLKPRLHQPIHPRHIPRPIRQGIVFDRVSFQYPSSDRKVLEDITISISPGETIALVGDNGAGKTTLIKLLLRLYDPTDGAILIDGTDIRDFRTTDLMREFSVIFQDYTRYHLTARENIWFGNIELPLYDERIILSARQAGIHNVIERLKNRYDTLLGKWLEDGEELSIGEWQKIALARAFLRDAQVVILDEPTSSMDAKSEYEVFKGLKELFAGRMVVLISHRFSTVRMADRIYVLNSGRIVESGSHEELIRAGGRYARMFEMQARAYR
ncbi:MAG: ABC transporter ATP-binding protein [Thermodesulfovibrionia bacterium]